jgi:hypothetical protein
MALNVHFDVHLTSQFQIRIVYNDTDLELRPLPDKRTPTCLSSSSILLRSLVRAHALFVGFCLSKVTDFVALTK